MSPGNSTAAMGAPHNKINFGPKCNRQQSLSLVHERRTHAADIYYPGYDYLIECIIGFRMFKEQIQIVVELLACAADAYIATGAAGTFAPRQPGPTVQRQHW